MENFAKNENLGTDFSSMGETPTTTSKWVYLLAYLILIILIALSFINLLEKHSVLSHFNLIDYPLHSTFEIIGAVVAIFVSLIPIQFLMGFRKPSFVFVSLGFFSMGLWDLVHAFTQAGDGFIFTHSTAMLLGGLFFALSCLNWSPNILKHKNVLFLIIFGSSIFFIVLDFLGLLPFPIMIENKQFNNTSNLINLFSGILFSVSALFFSYRFFKNRNLGILTIVYVSVLSAVSGFSFQYSIIWTDEWWFWHALRLISFIVVFIYLFWRIIDSNNERSKALFHLNQQHLLVKESEKKFKGLFNNDPSAIIIADPRTGILFDVNPAAEHLMEMDRNELIGMHQSKLHPEEVMAEQMKKFKQLQNEPNVSVASQILTKQGVRKHVEIKVSMVEIDNKPYILGIFHDVSNLIEHQNQLKRNEEKLRESEVKFRQTFDNSPVGVVMVGLDKKFTQVNTAYAKMLAYEIDEVVGLAIEDITYPEDKLIGMEDMMAIMKGEMEVSSVQKRYVRKDKQLIWVEVTISLLRNEEGIPQYFLGIVQDITQKKHWENELILKNIVFETSVSANSTADISGVLTNVNAAFLQIWGYEKAEEVVGRSLAEFIKYEKEALEIINSLNSTGKWTGEYSALKKDGTVFMAQANAGVLKDSDDKFIGYQSSVIDVTEKKIAEEKLKKTLENLERSNRELEQFAYVASHDLQEPLRMVSSYTQLLQKRYQGQLDERADKYIYYAVDGANRMQQLIIDLLEFSRVSTQGEDFVTTDLNETLKVVQKNLKFKITETKARIDVKKLPQIKGDERQLERLFQNLIVNAIKFSKPNVIPEIEISAEEHKKDWLIRIKDNGIGIDQKFKDKIFVIFQRLHGAGQYQGTGIGLTVCKKIAERHGGKIWFESKIGEGTEFFITFKK